MINKKKKMKSEASRLTLFLSLILILMFGATTSVKAQSRDGKTEIWMSESSDKGNDAVVISRVTTDSRTYGIPGFPGGMQAIFTFLKKNINYSSKAVDAKIQGDITVSFDVTREGTIANSRIVKSLSPDLDREVIAAVKRLPVGELTGKNEPKINTGYEVTLKFALPDSALLTEPTISVVGVETESLKMTVKRTDGGNYGTITVCDSPDMPEDTIISKMVTVVTKDSDGKISITTGDGL